MTAPVLPPPDLRDRDGWHLLQGHDEDQWEFTTALWWSAESGEWCNTAGRTKHGRDVVFCLPRNWVYVAPLFPVPDDAEAVERVAMALKEAPNLWLNGGGDVPWEVCLWRDGGAVVLAIFETEPEAVEFQRMEILRFRAHAAIAAIRKGSVNG